MVGVTDAFVHRPAPRDVIVGIGESGSRRLIPTPALICDVDRLLDNIERMASTTHKAGVAIRPHVKSHKSAFVARHQLDHGASGLAFAKLSEAEAVVSRLITEGWHRRISALITSPLAGLALARRAAALSAVCDLVVVADHVDAVDELATALVATPGRLSVLCDVDVGLARTGVVGPREAIEVVRRIDQSPVLDFAGVQGYGGHLQHIAGRPSRIAETQKSAKRLEIVIDALESNGYPVALRTGGGTGTSGIDIEIGVLNELQPGSYVFMDREYRDALGDDPEGRFAQSLFLATTVISANQEGFVTVDAGLKAMATDAGAPLVVDHEDSVQYHFFGDEQGLVTNGPDGPFTRGQRLDLVPPHCDPTVDRYDVIWLVEGETVVGFFDVDARGCSQ